MTEINLGLYFVSELVGTALLVLLGCGVVANVVLTKTKGFAGGFLMINWGWRLADFAGVLVSAYSGALINPAVAIAMLVAGTIALPMFFIAVAAAMLGAILGAILCWASYRQLFDEEEDPALTLAGF